MKFKHNQNLDKHSDQSPNDASTTWLRKLFESIDRMDAKAYAEFFADDASFQMANQAPAVGREAISNLAQFVFDQVLELKHEVKKSWVLENEILVEGRVFYHTKDARRLEFPFFSVFELASETNARLIRAYRAYIDAHELFLKN